MIVAAKLSVVGEILPVPGMGSFEQQPECRQGVHSRTVQIGNQELLPVYERSCRGVPVPLSIDSGGGQGFCYGLGTIQNTIKVRREEKAWK